MSIISLAIFVLLLFLTFFFVISEFAIVRVRRPRIDYLVLKGNKKARTVQRVLGDLNSYLSAAQLGVTLTALGMGWVGEPAVSTLIDSLFQHASLPENMARSISAAVAFLLITYVNVVIGELTPKTLAIQRTERTTLAIARPLILFHSILFPFIWILNTSAHFVTKLFGIDPAEEEEMIHSEEELRILLSDSYRGGKINQAEYRYVNRIFEFDDRMAREIMVPRTEMVVLDRNRSFQENARILRENKFTRYPVAEGDKDHIVGLINMKELFTERLSWDLDLRPFIRPIITVIETVKIKQLLVKMQKDRTHMAILIDEYGGTAGLITVEDILEEIVGEIRDEFDEDERPMIEQKGNRMVLDGKVLISDVNDLLGLTIDDSELDTIGGWMLTQRPDVQAGTKVALRNYHFQVTKTDGHQVKEIEVVKEK